MICLQTRLQTRIKDIRPSKCFLIPEFFFSHFPVVLIFLRPLESSVRCNKLLCLTLGLSKAQQVVAPYLTLIIARGGRNHTPLSENQLVAPYSKST